GQCLAGHAQQEPYYPLLEALGRLGGGRQGERVVELLFRHAPTWLAHLPSLVPREERPQLNREIFGATRERMLREFCAVLEAFTAAFALAIALEDLQWAAPSTLDALAAVARRGEPARLLLLATYCPGEAAAPPDLPGMARDLQRRGCAAEIA